MTRILVIGPLPSPAFAQQATVWRFDNVTELGGHPVTKIGEPKVIDTDLGKAVH